MNGPNRTPVEAANRLRALIDEAIGHPNSSQWARAVLDSVNDPPRIAYFVQCLSVAASSYSVDVLTTAIPRRCSFCLKAIADVALLVTSPHANICNECSEVVRRTVSASSKRSILSPFSRFFRAE